MIEALPALALAAGLLTVPPLRAAPAGNPNATLAYFDGAANATFDPVEPQSNSSVAQAAAMAAYDSLVRPTDAGDPIPGLAQSWEYNADRIDDTKSRSEVQVIGRLT